MAATEPNTSGESRLAKNENNKRVTIFSSENCKKPNAECLAAWSFVLDKSGVIIFKNGKTY